MALLLLSIVGMEMVGQGLSAEQELALQAEDARREEVQRYFGYEDLAYRYITIPYDITMQTNQQGRFVDIGYALFAFGRQKRMGSRDLRGLI